MRLIQLERLTAGSFRSLEESAPPLQSLNLASQTHRQNHHATDIESSSFFAPLFLNSGNWWTEFKLILGSTQWRLYLLPLLSVLSRLFKIFKKCTTTKTELWEMRPIYSWNHIFFHQLPGKQVLHWEIYFWDIYMYDTRISVSQCGCYSNR